MEIEEKIQKWADTGLLEGITDQDEIVKLVNYSDDTLNYYLAKPEPLSEVDQQISVWIFPVIRRIFRSKKDIDLIDLRNQFEEYVKGGKMKAFANDSFGATASIDLEVECLVHFVEGYLK